MSIIAVKKNEYEEIDISNELAMDSKEMYPALIEMLNEAKGTKIKLLIKNSRKRDSIRSTLLHHANKGRFDAVEIFCNAPYLYANLMDNKLNEKKSGKQTLPSAEQETKQQKIQKIKPEPETMEQKAAESKVENKHTMPISIVDDELIFPCNKCKGTGELKIRLTDEQKEVLG